MSEEMIKNLIARLNHNCSNACLNDASSCICTVNDIKDLIHLYNKEKEKNKKLFEEYNKRVATIIEYEQVINEIIDKIYEKYTDISEVVEDLEELLKRE